MKYMLPFFFVLLFSNVQGQYVGVINKIVPGEYQIEYDNQLINVYFNYNPSGGFDDLVGLEISEAEELALTTKLRNQIDLFPDGFRGKFLNSSIFPSHIKGTEAGYYFDNQIVVELSKSKMASFSAETQESIFCHELGHHFLTKMAHRSETIALKSYFNDLRNNHGDNTFNSDVTFHAGYVSQYAYGLKPGSYKAREEICEIFSYLVSDHGSEDLIEFVINNPNSILAKKTSSVIAYLQILDPAFTREYFLGKNVSALTVNNEKKVSPIKNIEIRQSRIINPATISAAKNSTGSSYQASQIKNPRRSTTIKPSKNLLTQTLINTNTTSINSEKEKTSIKKSKTKKKKSKTPKDGVFLSIVGSVALVGILTFAIGSDFSDK